MDSTLSGIAIVSIGTLAAALPLGAVRPARFAKESALDDSPSIGAMVAVVALAAALESSVTTPEPCSGRRTWVASRKASRNSAALPKRWLGSSFSARATTASNAGGRWASAMVLGRRSVPPSASAAVSASEPLYGSRPTSMRYRMAPAP